MVLTHFLQKLRLFFSVPIIVILMLNVHFPSTLAILKLLNQFTFLSDANLFFVGGWLVKALNSNRYSQVQLLSKDISRSMSSRGRTEIAEGAGSGGKPAKT